MDDDFESQHISEMMDNSDEDVMMGAKRDPFAGLDKEALTE